MFNIYYSSLFIHFVGSGITAMTIPEASGFL
jgi:hypothetical protein